MSRNQAVQEFNETLHISHNQVFTYLNCSLKYRFQYVECLPYERISIAQMFGRAIHTAIETYYRHSRKNREDLPLGELQEQFQIHFELDFEGQEVPVFYKKDLPDIKGAVEMGNAMLKVFHENITQAVQGFKIVDVEMPLSATLYTDQGESTDYNLTGIIDVLFQDNNGKLLVVDNKTGSKSISQSNADDNHQMTAYSYLLAANKFVFPTGPVKCRFDVLRKLKTPKLEHVYTERTAENRKRFSRIANAVLAGIDAGIYVPQASWLCSDCGYTKACKNW